MGWRSETESHWWCITCQGMALKISGKITQIILLYPGKILLSSPQSKLVGSILLAVIEHVHSGTLNAIIIFRMLRQSQFRLFARPDSHTLISLESLYYGQQAERPRFSLGLVWDALDKCCCSNIEKIIPQSDIPDSLSGSSMQVVTDFIPPEVSEETANSILLLGKAVRALRPESDRLSQNSLDDYSFLDSFESSESFNGRLFEHCIEQSKRKASSFFWPLTGPLQDTYEITQIYFSW